MGCGVRYHDLTLGQLGRLAACERKERECEGAALTIQNVSAALEVEETQAGRFIRDMVDRGWMYCVWKPEKRGRKGERSTYRMTPGWRTVSADLQAKGVLPDLCEWTGCLRRALPFRFRGKFYCQRHLQHTHCEGCLRRADDGDCPKLHPPEVGGDDYDS